MMGADRNRIASPFSLREKVADEVGRMREPSDGEGAPRRQTLTPNPSPVGEGSWLAAAAPGVLPFSLGEKVAGEARRMRALRRRALSPGPSPLGQARRPEQ